MRLIGKQLLADFKSQYSEVGSQVNSWEAEVNAANWRDPHELKQRYPKAGVVGGNKVVFDFKWNKYRLLTLVTYKNQTVQVIRFGTHKEYMKWKI